LLTGLIGKLQIYS